MMIVQYYKTPGISKGASLQAEKKICSVLENIDTVQTEQCYYIQTTEELTEEERQKLVWILSTPFQEQALSDKTLLKDGDTSLLIEIGPRLNFSTPMSTNAVSICKSVGLCKVTRIEASVRYMINFHGGRPSSDLEDRLVQCLHDRMTQCRYLKPVQTFELDVQSELVYEVDVIGKGRSALEKANKDLGLAFDDWDLDFYTELFQNKVKRNPTSVECFDLAQSNSEHSRHWFFRGKLMIDGKEEAGSLFKMIMATQDHTNSNNVIKFNDNSSGIQGYDILVFKPSDPTGPSRMIEVNKEKRHIIFTAETHNFPTGVAPFPGATTGTGGRIRDVHCTGRGAHVVAGTAGYSFGNLNIPGYELPWEESSFDYPANFAPPLEIAIEASNGASDYGNKFGEPVLAGFARSFGMEIVDGDRREYIKPIMFSGGIGQLEGSHVSKEVAKKGMEVAKVGGPVYRIGVGGGAASSVQVQGDNKSELDFGAVQRGDAEMEQKLNRLIRACVELGKDNPIASIHDQGAGGNGNVLKEIVEPAGAIIRASDFQLGDPTISILELWGAEYQETNAILLSREHMPLLEKIGHRERCAVSFVGTVTGDGKICLEDFKTKGKKKCTEDGSAVKKQKLENGASVEIGGDTNGHDSGAANEQAVNSHMTSQTTNGVTSNGHVINGTTNETEEADAIGDHRNYPVDLELEHVLGKMPQKVFHLNHEALPLKPLSVAPDLSVREALERVLRLPSVASKRYLTNKVDRCVTGLVAQQQCVGPLHTPLADVAVTALSYMEKKGSATSIGEQPIKGLIDPACGARMSVGEALTNLVFAKVSDLKDVKCSGNWMWPAKLPGEGAALVDACRAMCEVMEKLGIAIDGGKDSLSMAARVGDRTIKAPGTLVISAYVGCPDITLHYTRSQSLTLYYTGDLSLFGCPDITMTVTPDLKGPHCIAGTLVISAYVGCPDITMTVTPDLKTPSGKGCILYIDVSDGKRRLGGTAFAQCFKQLGNQSPDLDHPEVLKAVFTITQKLIEERKITSGHDISDGGIITCLLEMAFAGNCGLSVDLSSQSSSVIESLFHEELGLVLEVREADVQYVTEAYTAENISCSMIGHSQGDGPDSQVEIKVNGENVLSEKMVVLRDVWEETSFQLELRQANPECVSQEREGLKHRRQPPYKLTFDPDIVHVIPQGKTCPRVAVLREEGSNSDREMSAALMMAGFEVWDVNMQDLCSGGITLDRFHGVAFVGGFSYADVLGSAKGWAATAMFNQSVRDQFAAFRQRSDTFSFGVCNGCQLMGLLGWVSPDSDVVESETKQGVFLDHNDSERFECRFVTVKIYDSPAIMFKGMEGTVFGMWSAHGEGKMVFKNDTIYDKLKQNNLIPVKYVNDEGEATTVYPFNPNGSPDGVAALCSEDGCHLAIMPHPERCFLPWQCAWMPVEQRKDLDVSPWMKMFQNAFDWSVQVVNVVE